jgi:hypothetical protein
MKELVGLSSASTPTGVAKRKHADINIFTVASGLLYEVCHSSKGSDEEAEHAALRFNYDIERDEAYAKLGQILVY